MDRKALLDQLTLVKPALASNHLIPALTHLWFSGDRVMAYNDAIAISAPCKSGFTGMVQGEILLGMLSSSSAKDAKIAVSGNSAALVTVGQSKITLPILVVDKPLFEWPADAGKETLPVGDEKFLVGIEACQRSVTQDPSVPEQLGITIIPQDEYLELYATNGATISHVKVPITKRMLRRRVVLSAPFCEQLVRLAGNEKDRLVVADDYALLETADDVWLFGKLVEVEKPLDFGKLLAQVVPKNYRKIGLPMPKEFSPALDRALIISDTNGERAYTKLSVNGDRVSLFTKSSRGEIKDTVELEGQHDEVEASADPDWLKKGCAAGFQKLLITEPSVIMFGGSSLYLVATES